MILPGISVSLSGLIMLRSSRPGKLHFPDGLRLLEVHWAEIVTLTQPVPIAPVREPEPPDLDPIADSAH